MDQTNWLQSEWGDVIASQAQYDRDLQSKFKFPSELKKIRSFQKTSKDNQKSSKIGDAYAKTLDKNINSLNNGFGGDAYSKQLEQKLKGVTDNSERYKIVDSFMSGKEDLQSKLKTKSFQQQAKDKFSDNTHEKSQPFIGPTTENKNKSIKDKILNSKAGWAYKEFLGNMSSKLPNPVQDLMTASALGVQTKQTKLGRVSSLLTEGGAEFTGYNPITKSNINIDYLSNKIGNQNSLPVNMEGNEFKSTFSRAYNRFFDNLGASNLEKWKEMHREETSKSVRNIGDSIDPFDSGENQEYIKQKRLVERLNNETSTSKSLMDKQRVLGSLNRETNKLSTMVGNEHLPDIRARDALQLKEVEKRILDSQNNVKAFFNPLDKEELKMLQSTQSELTERLRRIDGNYGATRVNTDKLVLPKSVSESFKDLHDRRMEIHKRLGSISKSSSIYDQASRGRLSNELTNIDRQLAIRDSSPYSGFRPNQSSNLGSPEVKSGHRPVYGTSGYGLGFMNSFKASRTEHLMRGMHYLNPLGAGGASGSQAILETFGIMNKAQRMQATQARGFGKLGSAMVPGLGAAQLLLGMSNHDDAGQIFEDMFAVGASLQGWRTGTAFGGAVGRAGSVGRLVGLGLGGLTGLTLGYVAGTALVGGVRDIMSNESSIRKFAKNVSTKELTVGQQNTNQSITARQASLQKLAKSGLNDRGLLIGNEASILSGVM